MTTKGTAERIIEAALQLISEKGYTAATTKTIAELAGVNEVTLFRHFGNKRGLLKAIVEQFSYYPLLQQEIHQNVTWELEKDLLNFSLKHFEFLMSIKDLVMIGFKESIQFPEISEEIANIPLLIKKELCQYFQEMQQRGKIREVDFEAAALSLIALNFGHFMSRARLGTMVSDIPTEELLQTSVAIFSRGLVS
ncbi:TetR/AcrR family transcriptional regulator [Lysinibacillus sphaericus]|uniref:TetR/AcrR family transcriptional regulator n=1 Tax=Lysinibacillus pinottii TaxID=2973932 RepID=A0ABT2DRS2_9BACI|nr:MULTISPECIES: TetR/AcrR family transcriptional regulator [Lysinibacillus]MBE5082259.1 TetR/AcrR family transcriptional regulator [Bacillus thuringiensis]AMO34069.1 TetR family transcriptional regulator [Lysinibacillus sphaericus]AMR90821.1 TetR family transcriptional regulator [Lysinibacillus sphaericus]ANA44871.1 TetR family transcriptional regulator [Lysinibacillus sphaericus]KZL44335.1 TetR family transcriptional regulator [Lysinibacillus sphaericus]